MEAILTVPSTFSPPADSCEPEGHSWKASNVHAGNALSSKKEILF